ncbi:MAG: FMN-binding protein [Spirochaetes bacterium]|nr:FMN-binding protein [Spirochaetota bacterium]MBU1081881.1 FMN-binding protein [Spirochaetota bacterium]
MNQIRLKRLSGLLALMGLVASLSVSCASVDGSKGLAFKPGTYSAVAQGNAGDVRVTVTFSETRIVSIEIGENAETPGLSDPAFRDVPAAIIEGQTLAVDAVSGATHSSEAILSAVADCVEQAEGDVEAMKAR